MYYETLLAIAAIAAGVTVPAALKKFRHVFCVPEGWTGLLYQHGLYVRRNNAGRHVIWGCGWTVNLIDLRKASLQVAGQETLTADGVSLKAGLLVTYQVTEPVKAAHETQNWQGDLCHAAGLALRTVVCGVTVESLLDQRLEIGAQLLARAQPEAARIGINILAIEVTDAVFPAELRRAFAEEPKAKQ
jgi:regulator of protease activity HflC (stomatin/prohibitin superfamily)